MEGVLFPCYYNGVKTLMQVSYGFARNGLNMIEVQDLYNTFGATVFRGTGDLHSTRRDLEYLFEGVGIYSFEGSRDSLLEKFRNQSKP